MYSSAVFQQAGQSLQATQEYSAGLSSWLDEKIAGSHIQRLDQLH
jgi:hypothetical protein